MSQLLEEIKELDDSNRWNPAFQLINLETRNIIDKKTINHARRPNNRSLNRYRDVLPYDDTRVCLKSNQNDYINANYVEVAEVNKKYILTQGPLAHTCKDFWLMIWENKTKGIIMLNRIVEKNMMKCHPYWPMGENEVASYGDFEITNKSSTQENSYIIRHLYLSNLLTGEDRLVYQYHFTTWPDFGVPQEPLSFIKFLESIRKAGILDPSCPPVIHCSAGIGRSGTFILVDVALAKAEKDKSPDLVKPKELLLKMREYRCGLIQTAEQFRFANVVIMNGFLEMFPELFDDDINDDENDGEPPPLPPRNTKNNIPPTKPDRQLTDNKIVLESSDDDDDDVEEELINLSDVTDDDDDDDDDYDTVESKNDMNTTSPTRNDIGGARVETKDDGQPLEHDTKDVENIQELHVNRDVNNKESENVGENSINKVKTGDKASGNDQPQLRHRQKIEKTKEIVDNIKKKMKESENEPNYKKPLMYFGIAVTICAGIYAVYRYLS